MATAIKSSNQGSINNMVFILAIGRCICGWNIFWRWWWTWVVFVVLFRNLHGICDHKSCDHTCKDDKNTFYVCSACVSKDTLCTQPKETNTHPFFQRVSFLLIIHSKEEVLEEPVGFRHVLLEPFV